MHCFVVPGDLRFDIGDTRRQQNGPRPGRATFRLHLEKITVASETIHMGRDEGDAVEGGLLPQQDQKLMTGDAGREARVVVAPWDPFRPAAPGIEHRDRSPVARKIERCRETSRSAADNETVEDRRFVRGRRHRHFHSGPQS